MHITVLAACAFIDCGVCGVHVHCFVLDCSTYGPLMINVVAFLCGCVMQGRSCQSTQRASGVQPLVASDRVAYDKCNEWRPHLFPVFLVMSYCSNSQMHDGNAHTKPHTLTLFYAV